MWITTPYLLWSNDEMTPSWLHGNLVGCTSVPDASTDESRAYSRAPDAPATAPTVANNYKQCTSGYTYN